MYVIAVANEKGGVAKTTTALSLGAAFVEMGLRVLLIDLDAQAGLCLALGLDPMRVEHPISEVLMRASPVFHVLRGVGMNGLDLVPANRDMVMMERFLPTQKDYENILRRTLQDTTLNYDFVVIDCPPMLGAVTLNALVAAHLLVAPTQAEFFSIYSLRNLLGLVRQVRARYNPRLSYRLLLTLYDRRTRTHRMMADKLRESFGGGLFETVIEMDTRVRESAIAGQSVLTYRNGRHSQDSRAAEQYRTLAHEILSYVRAPVTPTAD